MGVAGVAHKTLTQHRLNAVWVSQVSQIKPSRRTLAPEGQTGRFAAKPRSSSAEMGSVLRDRAAPQSAVFEIVINRCLQISPVAIIRHTDEDLEGDPGRA
jgi:hypothetical protein